jgi:hypothetical protein
LQAGAVQAMGRVVLAEGADRGEVVLPRPPGALQVRMKEAAGGPSVTLLDATFTPLKPFPEGYRYTLFVENRAQTPQPLTVSTARLGGATLPALSTPYAFDAGWRYAMIVPAGDAAIPEGATAIVLWVEADGSGDALRTRFRDRTGQTFQVDLARLDWKGWRAVTIPLDGRAANTTHWGGANNGTLNGPIAWEGLLLIDSVRRDTPHQGMLRVASPMYVTK